MVRESYELAKSLLKPPLRILGIVPGTSQPTKLQYDEHFNSLEEVYGFFRRKRPEGRWLIWIQGSDGQEIGLDSKKWEEAIGK